MEEGEEASGEEGKTWVSEAEEVMAGGEGLGDQEGEEGARVLLGELGIEGRPGEGVRAMREVEGGAEAGVEAGVLPGGGTPFRVALNSFL
jgi:hypothetical protein